jgi:hypothetical protein
MVKKFLICFLAIGVFAAVPVDMADAASKTKKMSKAERSKLTAMAIKACRKKFGPGVMLRDIEFYNGKVKRVWCY